MKIYISLQVKEAVKVHPVKVVSNTCIVWVCLGVLMCFLMCQCVHMPRSVSGLDMWIVICVMLGFMGVDCCLSNLLFEMFQLF